MQRRLFVQSFGIEMIKQIASVVSAGVAVALGSRYAGMGGRQGAAEGVPVGTVMAYAGLFTPEGIRALEDSGWLPCDGRALRRVDAEGKPTAYAGLAAVLGNGFGAGFDGEAAEPSGDFNVPDLRGRFVRGVDAGTKRDAGAANRKPMRRGGNAGDAVGSVQGYSTALPTYPFVTDAQGAHGKHWSGSYGTAEFGGYPVLGYPGSETTLGEHSHTIVGGGDPETRPVNLALNWIVKFR